MSRESDLNWLNEKYAEINRTSNSVPVQALIKKHRIETRKELYQQIKNHYEGFCKCGLKSQGTVEMFGDRLYEAQIGGFGERRYSLLECRDWAYDLFVTKSMRGHDEETIVKTQIEVLFRKNGYKNNVRYATDQEDREYGVDIVVEKDGKPIYGFQIKPESYKQVNEEIKKINMDKIKKWGHPIKYYYYDYGK